MNHDRVKLFTEKLDNLTVSDYYGLNSPGLTCYLNSVLQVLFMTEDFRGSIKRCCSNGSTTIDTLLGKLFKDLERGLAKTHRFIINLGITDVYKQCDAAEYFERILCLTSLEASKIFNGKLIHKTTCVRCKKTSDSSAFFWILPLAMKNSPRHTYSVETGLKAFFNKDHVHGDDKMFCDHCNEKQEAFIECELAQTPVVLTLLLKRFTFDPKERSYVKLHCGVDVPQTLHIGNCKYDLYALVDHYGNISGGHYTAQIRSFETGEWYCFNDDTVQRVRRPLFGSRNSVRSRTAYLVLYRKGSTHSETSHEVDQEAEGRRDEAETGEALPPPLHPLRDESNGGGENLKLLNGDAFNSSDEMSWMKLTDSCTEAEKQLNTKQSNRKQLNTNSLKERLQPETAWDSPGQDRSPTREKVKPAAMNGVRTERESVSEEDRGRSIKHRSETDVSLNAADSVIQPFHCSPSPPRHLTNHSEGSCRVSERSLCRGSRSWRTTTTNSKSREETVKREPWR